MLSSLRGVAGRPLGVVSAGCEFSRRCLAIASGPSVQAPSSNDKKDGSPEHCDVLIVGSGLVGSALACALGTSPYLSQHRIVMLDGMPKPPSMPSPDSPFSNRVVALRPAAVRFLQSVRAWEIIESVRASPFTHMQVWDACADAAIRFDAESSGREVLGYLAENNLIQASLQRVIDTQGRVEACWGARIAAVEQIGADGLNSFVRKAVGINTIGWEAHAFHRPGIRPPQSPPQISSVAPGSRAAFPLGFGHSVQYIAHRTALVGDAAHRVHPLAGQGVNLGFGDVEDLAKRIVDDAYCGLDLGNKQTLLAYETTRQRSNAPMMLATDALKRLYTTDWAPVVALRALGLNATNAMAPLKKLLMEHAMAA